MLFIYAKGKGGAASREGLVRVSVRAPLVPTESASPEKLPVEKFPGGLTHRCFFKSRLFILKSLSPSLPDPQLLLFNGKALSFVRMQHLFRPPAFSEVRPGNPSVSLCLWSRAVCCHETSLTQLRGRGHPQ